MSQIEPKLSVQVGYASLQGRRPDNQDFGGHTQPGPSELGLRGMVAVVADGMGGAKGGRVAAETCVRLFLDGYCHSAATLSVEQAAAQSLDAANRWIHALGRRDAQLADMATTFSALVLRHRQAHLIHVGDSRIYRLRGAALEKLTEDHTLKHPDQDHILYRAVGIEDTLCADSATLALEAHDRFLLCSDGLHASLRERDIRAALLARGAPLHCAETLAQMAFDKGSQDNITVLVIDVISLPPPNRSTLQDAIAALPLRPLPEPGQSVDSYALESIIATGRYSTLFLAHDSASPTPLALKFPHPNVASEREYGDAFLREAWIGARVHSPWVAEVIEPPPGRQSRLYTVMPYYDGDTLEQRIADGGPVGLEEGVALALKLCKAVHALHRLRVIHRDIKPDNILLLADGGLKLLDLGIARLPAFAEDEGAAIPGTPSHMAPEQFAGERGSVATDVYAVGVTLFRLFGGAYPYGEIEPFCTPRFHGRCKSLAHCRPDLPSWLGATLARAVAIDPQERPADIMELAYELENGLAKGGPVSLQKRSWHERNPLLFWKLTSLLLFGLLLVCAAKLALGA